MLQNKKTKKLRDTGLTYYVTDIEGEPISGGKILDNEYAIGLKLIANETVGWETLQKLQYLLQKLEIRLFMEAD